MGRKRTLAQIVQAPQFMKTIWIFLCVFAAHSVAQFAAWAVADAPQGSHAAWTILSCPTLALLGGVADGAFWPLMIVNSLLWSAAMSGPFWYASTRRASS
jgi:hypothetical protein